jgi:hypothetical protein
MNIGLSDAIRHMHRGFETVTVSHSLRQIEQAAPNNDALAPRIALLTPYNGGNLGDASIQVAVVANVGGRLPNARFSGICLNCTNFVERHGVEAFPLAGRNIPWYSVWPFVPGTSPPHGTNQKGFSIWATVKVALKNVPVLLRCLRVAAIIPQEILRVAAIIPQEIFHSVGGYRFLCKQDLLVVSGGGQLNEQYGGAWGQPFALFKWAVLARLARVPYVVINVGSGNVVSVLGRLFVSAALLMACYRSYRVKIAERLPLLYCDERRPILWYRIWRLATRLRGYRCRRASGRWHRTGRSCDKPYCIC